MEKKATEKLEAEFEAVEKKASSMLKEFRDFINRGNMLDLAIGVVIGAAFTKLTGAFMDYLVNPIVGLCTGGVDFGQQFILLKGKEIPAVASAKTVEEVAKAGGLAWGYGAFITAAVNFLVVMLVMFFVVKAYNKMKDMGKKEEAAAEAPPKPEDVVLLEEIRDLLKSK